MLDANDSFFNGAYNFPVEPHPTSDLPPVLPISDAGDSFLTGGYNLPVQEHTNTFGNNTSNRLVPEVPVLPSISQQQNGLFNSSFANYSSSSFSNPSSTSVNETNSSLLHTTSSTDPPEESLMPMNAYWERKLRVMEDELRSEKSLNADLRRRLTDTENELQSVKTNFELERLTLEKNSKDQKKIIAKEKKCNSDLEKKLEKKKQTLKELKEEAASNLKDSQQANKEKEKQLKDALTGQYEQELKKKETTIADLRAANKKEYHNSYNMKNSVTSFKYKHREKEQKVDELTYGLECIQQKLCGLSGVHLQQMSQIVQLIPPSSLAARNKILHDFDMQLGQIYGNADKIFESRMKNMNRKRQRLARAGASIREPLADITNQTNSNNRQRSSNESN
ncbi:unnamed protein product [Ambrosiozyma monospora]|uniref:Unnamed protein product n=1 Tax=Ambrosiozyma monospora TaxID=43982 RepID=A0ACB5TN84_AMBMO|nr:unnamed protein product [Ambrosiozyma monospora]